MRALRERRDCDVTASTPDAADVVAAAEEAEEDAFSLSSGDHGANERATLFPPPSF